MSALVLPPEIFASVAAWLNRQSGMLLSADKTYLLETRLQPVAAEHGYASTLALLEAVHSSSLRSTTAAAIIEAMTTNESLFFRDGKPFDALITTMLPALQARGAHEISIWSAACSSGQEAYSIAMRLSEHPATTKGTRIALEASDLSASMVARARSGVYSQLEVQRGLPITHLLKFFTQIEPQRWQIKPELITMIRFFEHNLLSAPPAAPYHIIFCRYVLIYFDEATRAAILQKISASLAPGGYLVLGSSEAIRDAASFDLSAMENCSGGFVKAL